MQSLQERRPSPRFPLQTPILAHHDHELSLLTQGDFVDVVYQPVHDDLGDKRGS